MIFLLNVLVPLSCFQSVFQRGLDILNPVDLFLVKMLLKFFLYFLNIFFLRNLLVAGESHLSSSLYLSPLYTIVSRSEISFSEISALNLIEA